MVYQRDDDRSSFLAANLCIDALVHVSFLTQAMFEKTGAGFVDFLVWKLIDGEVFVSPRTANCKLGFVLRLSNAEDRRITMLEEPLFLFSKRSQSFALRLSESGPFFEAQDRRWI